MNRRETAELLGKSERTVSEYVAAGKLKQSYRPSKTGKQAHFEESDVRQLKEELEATTQRAVVVSGTPPADTSLRGESQERFIAALDSMFSRQTEVALTELDVKPILKLSEAMRLTGLPRSILLDAIKAGRLKASDKWGRGWKLKRSDLDSWIAEL